MKHIGIMTMNDNVCEKCETEWYDDLDYCPICDGDNGETYLILLSDVSLVFKYMYSPLSRYKSPLALIEPDTVNVFVTSFSFVPAAPPE